MIAVTGANGQLGQKVIQTLLKTEKPETIVALVRDPDSATSLKEKGVVVRHADYNQPSTLPLALKGVNKLLLISGTEFGKRVEQHKAVIDAAIAEHVSLIAYTSLLNADTSPLLLAQEHKQTEIYLKEVNAPYVILRNGWYTENYTDNAPTVLSMGTLVGAAKQGIISSASRQDYADAAAAVLTAKDQKTGCKYELAGDSGFTLREYASTITELTGTEINVIDMEEDVYKQVLVDAGLPEGIAVAIADTEQFAASGWLEDDSHSLSRLIGRSTTPLKETLREALNR